MIIGNCQTRYPEARQENDIFNGIHAKHPLTEYVEFLKPIPLTEQWLLDFGFEINPSFKNNVYVYVKINRDPIELYYNDGWCSTNPDFDWKIKYVHELQNVFYWLTKEELTIKSGSRKALK